MDSSAAGVTGGRVIVIGLGPAGPELVNEATRAAIDSVPLDRRFLRTARHPATSLLAGAATYDSVYDEEATLDAVYRRIVDELCEAAASSAGDVLYAVPGSPAVAERTVELLLAEDRVTVEVVPALSFLDLAWVRLGIDPIAVGVRVVDGQRFAVEAAGQRGPVLVAQCDSKLVLSDVKLALGEAIDAGADDGLLVTVLQGLGLPDERITEVGWAELDRQIDPDHLTSLLIPALSPPIGVELQRFVELVATLRRECPWDREQTHQSLERHLLEEAYEVLDAIDGLDTDAGTGYEHLEEELGDLLFQVVFHSTLATEAGQFTLADVARTVHDKLYGRHPHVFGDTADDSGLAAGDTASDVAANWEQLKKVEKGRDSVFDGIPDALPALLFALKVQKKAVSLGDDTPAVLDRVLADIDRSADAETVGALLWTVVSLARRAGVDPETALRSAARIHRDEAKRLET
jgi:tetrapyrrole methylase family protein/MazG family protein